MGTSALAVGGSNDIDAALSSGVGLLRILITALFGIIAWFLIRTLKQIDANQTEIYNRLRDVETESAITKARCESLACKHHEAHL